MIVAAAFYRDLSTYPNIGRTSVEERFAAYWRCLATLTLSTRFFGRSHDRILIFTNDTPPNTIQPQLDAAGVELIELPFGYAPPEGFYGSFGGAFYLLDALDWAAETLREDETILFLDPDCVVTGPLNPVAEAVSSSGLLLYDTSYGERHVANGHSRASIAALADRFPGDASHRRLPRWIGGEFIGGTGAGMRALHAAAQQIWNTNLDLFKEGEEKLNTEEQVLSMACFRYPLLYDTANEGFVSRIWTASRHRRHSAADLANTVWHLPAEKSHGFPKALAMLTRWRREGVAPTEAHRRALAKCMSLEGRSLREAAYLARWAGTRVVNLALGKGNAYP